MGGDCQGGEGACQGQRKGQGQRQVETEGQRQEQREIRVGQQLNFLDRPSARLQLGQEVLGLGQHRRLEKARRFSSHWRLGQGEGLEGRRHPELRQEGLDLAHRFLGQVGQPEGLLEQVEQPQGCQQLGFTQGLLAHKEVVNTEDMSHPSPQLFEGPSSEKLGEIRTVLDLGIHLQYEVSRDRNLKKSFLKYLDGFAMVPPAKEHRHKQKDVLPLPLPSLRPLNTWLEHEVQSVGGRRKHQARLARAESACESVWLWLVVLGLNREFLGDTPLAPELCNTSTDSPYLTDSQSACLDQLRKTIAPWCKKPLEVYKLDPFSEIFKKSHLDYSGEEVVTALPLVAGELEPGFPAVGVAGTVEATSVCDPLVAEWLLSPQEHILPRSKWPPKVPLARMNCSLNEWYKVVALLWERSMIKPIPYSKIFRVNGQPVLNGAFAVSKKGTPAEGFLRITRFIVNLVPSNSYQSMLQTDLGTLTPSSHWSSMILGENNVLLWSSDDQKGAYYVFLLPEVWLPFMTFAWPVPGYLVGLPHERETYVACSVIPMGWLSAVSLFQHIHRRLGFAERPLGAQHEPESEWRRDKRIPVTLMKKNRWVQFYLDDFDAPEEVSKEEMPSLVGTMGPAQKKQRSAYARVGVSVSEEKAIFRQPLTERMGATVDGLQGTISVPKEKAFIACLMILYLLSCLLVHLRSLQSALGRLIRVFEFRRPLFGVLNDIWQFGQSKIVSKFTESQTSELLIALCLTPLAISDLRTQVSGLVTCSDASEKGGGVCKSSGLSPLGFEILKKIQTKDTPLSMGDPSAAQLDPITDPIKHKIAIQVINKPRVLVISLFDGIGGLLAAVSRLPIVVVGFAASEIDSACKRLVKKRWPGVIELGSVTKIDYDCIEKLAKTYGGIVDLVLVGAGSPCQDLSSLLYNRQGLLGERSRLFFEVPRIIELLSHFFSCVHFFVENVFSMSPESRATFSSVLGVTPYLVDASNFTYCRRPRLFWCSWAISNAHAKLVDKGGYVEVTVKCQKLSPSFWLDAGSVWDPNNGLVPTLTRCLPNKKPPRQPAGIQTASARAIHRWHQDDHAFQVYQYEDHAMVRDITGVLRLPSISERELLMGFDRDYTTAAFSEKTSHRERFVTAAQMVGNSFCVPVISYLVAECLMAEQLIKVPLPPELGLAFKQPPQHWSSHAEFKPGEGETQSSKELVWEHLRIAERGGSDVRLDVNVPFRPKAWPRAGIQSNMWHWKIVHGYAWKSPAHINALEMQAALNAMKWRARSRRNFNKRYLHLIDSQVSAAILTKGRSGSKRLRKTIKKINAYTLACGFYPCYCYVHTSENPADIPSRWGSRGNRFAKSKK